MKVPFLDLSLQHRALREPALAALAATYDANRFCLGKDVEEFEKNFAATLGYPRALGMNSGTSPLHVACMIAGFGPGDEVITTPFTFISSAWGISYVGAKPVFADIEEGTFNLDPAKLAAAVTPFIVHTMERQIALGARRDHAIVFGRGQNHRFLERLNAERGWFGSLHPLDHPRSIVQYKRKQLAAYVERYAALFEQLSGRE